MRTRALCLGEGLVVLQAVDHDLLRCSVGGCEANVAGGLAGLGFSTAWVSRLGRDPFGQFVERDLAARGVTVLVERDGDRPTGAYLKEVSASGSRMHYYRAGSAATGMDSRLLALPAVADALATCEVVHTSGITAGILARPSDLIPELVRARDEYGFLLSVDLNWRPALWRERDVRVLHELLGVADILLLGADEAEAVLGTADPDRLRAEVGHRPRLVIKSDAHVAVEIDPDGTTTEVPALHVDVVEPIGAGDGFAAGYLAGILDGCAAVARLRLGHLVAAGVLAEHGDHARKLPDASLRASLLAAPAETWRATRVSAAGVTMP